VKWLPHPETFVRFCGGVWCITHWATNQSVYDSERWPYIYRLEHRFGPRKGITVSEGMVTDDFDLNIPEAEIIALAASCD
jgi:hypothetical protein